MVGVSWCLLEHHEIFTTLIFLLTAKNKQSTSPPRDALLSCHTLKSIMKTWSLKHGFCILGCEVADEKYKWALRQIALPARSLTGIPQTRTAGTQSFSGYPIDVMALFFSWIKDFHMFSIAEYLTWQAHAGTKDYVRQQETEDRKIYLKCTQ